MRKLLILFLAVALGVGTFSLYALDVTEYGATWDELIFHRNYGRYYTEFLKTGNLESIAIDDNASWFPPVAVTIGNVFLESKFLSQFYSTNTDRFHLAGVLFGSITASIVFLFAYLLWKRAALAVFASLLLVLHPQFVTQAHTNVRDMGLTMFYSLTLLVLFYSTRSPHKLAWMSIAGLLVGITTDTKQNGALLLFTGLTWFLFHIRSYGIKRFIAGSIVFACCSDDQKGYFFCGSPSRLPDFSFRSHHPHLIRYGTFLKSSRHSRFSPH